MKTISTFELVDHGIEESSYFQGCGTTFTSYENVATGIGVNPAEAIDDCLEMVAQQGIDVSDMEARILAQEGLTALPITPEVTYSEDSEDSELWYHVSIRWNNVSIRCNDGEIAPAYIYCADIFCGACGAAIYEGIYGSSEYPQGVSDDEESDYPQHCGSGSDCLDPTHLPDGSPVGKLFGRLTADGENYVREAIREGGAVAELWADHFGLEG